MRDGETIETRTLAAIVPANVVLITLDVAGRRCADGTSGASFAGHQAISGCSGRAGGDASLAQEGEEAGTIEVRLGSEAAGRLALAGLTTLPGQGRREVHQSIEIGDSGSVYLM